jgi:hypothetical protein
MPILYQMYPIAPVLYIGFKAGICLVNVISFAFLTEMNKFLYWAKNEIDLK